MAQANVSGPMREFLARNEDRPIGNSVFEHNGDGALIAERCEGSKSVYVKTLADRDQWEELIRPFDVAPA